MTNPICDDKPIPAPTVKPTLDYALSGGIAGRLVLVRNYGTNLAWYSLLAEVILLGLMVLGAATLPFLEDERTAATWVFYYSFVVLAAVGVLTAIASLFGIHSARTAFRILPGALLALAFGPFLILACMYVCAVTGKRWG